mmetsp:Transcript_1661/g.3794  ORF Transcript_1661/g.3794 Transcript_1661/m.3794 type:complete len:204 (-) Transcript_1661:12-623(-)
MRPESARICSLIWSTFFCTAAAPPFFISVFISPSTALFEPMSSPLYTVLFKLLALPSRLSVAESDESAPPDDAVAPLFFASSARFFFARASLAASLTILAFSCFSKASLTSFCLMALLDALCPIPLIMSISEGRWHDDTQGVDPQSTASTTLPPPLGESAVATNTSTTIAPKAIAMKAAAPRWACISLPIFRVCLGWNADLTR